jgi:hypothetical protein
MVAKCVQLSGAKMETLVQRCGLTALQAGSCLIILVHRRYSVEKKFLLTLDIVNSNASGSYNESNLDIRFNLTCSFNHKQCFTG